MHTYALQRIDLDLKQQVDLVECTHEQALLKAGEQAEFLKPGFLCLWRWHPKEGWQYVTGYYRITASGPVRTCLDPLVPPDDLHALPGDGSALEFQPEQFHL